MNLTPKASRRSPHRESATTFTTHHGDRGQRHTAAQAPATEDRYPEPVGLDVTRCLLPTTKLERLAVENSHEYLSATPFPHIILDDLFDPLLLEAVLAEFPGPYDIEWERFWRVSDVHRRSSRKLSVGSCSISRVALSALRTSKLASPR